jgi:phosphoribosyl-AMP cyclohydrolase
MADTVETTAQFRPKFDASGLLTAVVTDVATGDILMLAHMNAEAVERTLATGEAHFWSRSRAKLWKKGETSGNVLKVQEIRTDCDQDALWLKVRLDGEGACHTGEWSCFYRTVSGGANGEAPALSRSPLAGAKR